MSIFSKKIYQSFLVVSAFIFSVTLAIIFLNLKERDLFAEKISSTGQSASLGSFAAPRGVAGDLWADIVIGQRDFTEINPNEIVADKVFNPGGIIVSNSASSSGKAYIWDSNNNRILGIDLADCYSRKTIGTRCKAQIVIGQPSANDYGACNHDSSSQSSIRVGASSDSLCGVKDSAFSLEEQRSKSNMAVDVAGNLYVADIENNRVLKYNNPFASENDTVADAVWGQTSFGANSCNKGGNRPSASTICFDFGFWGSGGIEKHGGVAIDSQGSLWVADTANNRVVRFLKQNNKIAVVADIVLGQTDFTNSYPGSTLDKLEAPTALTFDPSGKLYVADSGNTRILVFTPPFTSGMSGVTFGRDFAHNQPYSTNCNTATGGYEEAYTGCDGNPWDVQLDPLGQGIWTYETIGWNSRIRLWSFTGVILKNIDNSEIRGGGSLGIDRSGNILFSIGSDSDIARYQRQANGSYVHVQDFFSPPAGHNLVTGRRLLLGKGGIAIAGDQLVVSDGRLLFWNNLNALTNGKTADGYLRTSLSDDIHGFADVPSVGVTYIKSAAGRLWVSRRDKILIYQLPLHSGATPIKTISSLPVLGGGTINLSIDTPQEISGIAVDPTGAFLWITQTGSHRVLRIRNPLSSSPVVDVILGQPNVSSVYCNQNQADPTNSNSYIDPNPAFTRPNTLCYPGALAIDRRGNLYVSDHFHESAGNRRLLMFSSETFPNAPSNLVAAPFATKEFPRSQRFATWEPAFDSTNRMVAGYNPYAGKSRRVDYFNDPTGPVTVADGQLNDFNAWPLAATFDSQDNLYIYEANRGQVRIYKKPFNATDTAPFAEAEPSPTSTPPVPSLPTLSVPTFSYDQDGVIHRLFLRFGTDGGGRIKSINQISPAGTCYLLTVPVAVASKPAYRDIPNCSLQEASYTASSSCGIYLQKKVASHTSCKVEVQYVTDTRIYTAQFESYLPDGSLSGTGERIRKNAIIFSTDQPANILSSIEAIMARLWGVGY